MRGAFSTVQAGSTVIGSATGDTLVVDSADADQFNIGDSVLVWPSGEALEASTAYDAMYVTDKASNTLTVVRNEDHASATIAAGDQVALTFPPPRPTNFKQIQVITAGKTPGQGPTIDLGPEALGLVSLATATISNVNTDGGTGTLSIAISVVGSLDGVTWDSTVTTSSGVYQNAEWSVGTFSADDPAPLYSQFQVPRYIRFTWFWEHSVIMTNLGDNASATVALELEYY